MNYEKQKRAEALAIETLRIVSDLVGIFADDDVEVEELKKIPIVIFYIYLEKIKKATVDWNKTKKFLRARR